MLDTCEVEVRAGHKALVVVRARANKRVVRMYGTYLDIEIFSFHTFWSAGMFENRVNVKQRGERSPVFSDAMEWVEAKYWSTFPY